MVQLRLMLPMFCLFALGILVGQSDVLRPEHAVAQTADDPSQEAVDKMKASLEALNGAMSVLQSEQRYTSAIRGVNAFAVTVGGVDALRDLEDGRGVDPETFAALYAGQASEEIRPHLGFDEDGQLTYKNKLVRMYSTGRLKKLFAERAKYAGLDFD